jgi:CRISPR-associated endoribonuclease Cas6
MYFFSMVFRLWISNFSSGLGAADGVYAHAAILDTITRWDASLGKALHDMRRHKCVSVALLPTCENQKDQILLRLTFMAEEGLTYANAVVNILSQDPLLRLGKHECHIQDFQISHSPWTGIASWTDLTAPSQKRSLQFIFHTPTAINRRGTKSSRFTQMFPEPDYLFGGLSRRWQALQGKQLPNCLDEYLSQGGCVVADYSLHSTTFATAERKQVAFLGTVIYRCLADEHECIQTLNNLTRFAFFTGVGYQTARGMGCVSTSLLD